MADARSDRLALTYDSAGLTDGVGAQLQRIYGIYSISRLLGVSYVHTPIGRVDYQGLSALQRNAADASFHAEFNALCRIPSDPLPTNKVRTVALKNISPEIFQQLVAASKAPESGGLPLLVQLRLPYGIADRFPECYEICKQLSPFTRDAGRRLRVALHVRRGELFVVSSDRMLPNSYYVDAAQKVVRTLDALGVDYSIELHTEVADAAFTVRPGDHGIGDRIAVSAAVTPAMSRLEEFDVLPNLVRCINEPAVDCLRKLATADVLVMSHSSFSYVAAILNRSGVVLYHRFWHNPLSSWLTMGDAEPLDEPRFRQRIEGLRSQLATGGAFPEAELNGLR
ncbi:MAG: hypothetical protein WDM94_10390 [Bauldia sp.]